MVNVAEELLTKRDAETLFKEMLDKEKESDFCWKCSCIPLTMSPYLFVLSLFFWYFVMGCDEVSISERGIPGYCLLFNSSGEDAVLNVDYIEKYGDLSQSYYTAAWVFVSIAPVFYIFVGCCCICYLYMVVKK